MNKYDIEPRHPIGAAEAALSKRLGFGLSGQDWEIENAERTFATAEEALRWAEAEFGVKHDQWRETPNRKH